MDNLDADPWASPAVSKSQTTTVRNQATPSADAITAVKPTRIRLGEDARTTSAFTTHSEAGGSNGSIGEFNGNVGGGSETGGGWGSSGAAQGGLGADGFGSSTGGSGNPSGGGTVRSLGGGRTTTSGAEEIITVTLLPEKEGMFMFQHHNYEVKSRRRGSSVIRRYSDFVWLLDCLHRRYPFRQLPLLPPKRVAGMYRYQTGLSVINMSFSEWKAPLIGHIIHRKAKKRPCPLSEFPCATSNSGSGAARGNVLDSAHCKPLS